MKFQILFSGKKEEKYFKMSPAEIFTLPCTSLREMDTLLKEATLDI